MRNAVTACTGLRFLVADAVGVDGLAALVGEEQVSDFVLVGEILQHVDRIVADADDLRASGFDLLNVVLQHNDESFSLLVDEVGDVINVPSETMEPVPHTLEAHWKTITQGVFRLEERLFIILNVEAILTFN